MLLRLLVFMCGVPLLYAYGAVQIEGKASLPGFHSSTSIRAVGYEYKLDTKSPAKSSVKPSTKKSPVNKSIKTQGLRHANYATAVAQYLERLCIEIHPYTKEISMETIMKAAPAKILARRQPDKQKSKSTPNGHKQSLGMHTVERQAMAVVATDKNDVKKKSTAKKEMDLSKWIQQAVFWKDEFKLPKDLPKSPRLEKITSEIIPPAIKSQKQAKKNNQTKIEPLKQERKAMVIVANDKKNNSKAPDKKKTQTVKAASWKDEFKLPKDLPKSPRLEKITSEIIPPAIKSQKQAKKNNQTKIEPLKQERKAMVIVANDKKNNSKAPDKQKSKSTPNGHKQSLGMHTVERQAMAVVATDKNDVKKKSTAKKEMDLSKWIQQAVFWKDEFKLPKDLPKSPRLEKITSEIIPPAIKSQKQAKKNNQTKIEPLKQERKAMVIVANDKKNNSKAPDKKKTQTVKAASWKDEFKLPKDLPKSPRLEKILSTREAVLHADSRPAVVMSTREPDVITYNAESKPPKDND